MATFTLPTDDLVKYIAALNDLRDCAVLSNALEESTAESADHWDDALDAAKQALARQLVEPVIPAVGVALGALEGLLGWARHMGGWEASEWAIAAATVDLLKAGGAVPLPGALALFPKLLGLAESHVDDWSTGLEDGTYDDDDRFADAEAVIAAANAAIKAEVVG